MSRENVQILGYKEDVPACADLHMFLNTIIEAWGLPYQLFNGYITGSQVWTRALYTNKTADIDRDDLDVFFTDFNYFNEFVAALRERGWTDVKARSNGWRFTKNDHFLDVWLALNFNPVEVIASFPKEHERVCFKSVVYRGIRMFPQGLSYGDGTAT